MSNETEQQQLWTVEDEIEASIKPCPKCGGKAVIEKFDEVVCLECGLWSGDEWESLEYAVDWWNKQPLIDDLRAQVAALTAERDEWKTIANIHGRKMLEYEAERDAALVASRTADANLIAELQAELEAAREWQPVPNGYTYSANKFQGRHIERTAPDAPALSHANHNERN